MKTHTLRAILFSYMQLFLRDESRISMGRQCVSAVDAALPYSPFVFGAAVDCFLCGGAYS
jgi:hypothetical protein